MARPADMELPLRILDLISECPGTGPIPIAAALDAAGSSVDRAVRALEGRRWIKRMAGGGFTLDIAAAAVWTRFRRLQEFQATEAAKNLTETDIEDGEVAATAATHNGQRQ